MSDVEINNKGTQCDPPETPTDASPPKPRTDGSKDSTSGIHDRNTEEQHVVAGSARGSSEEGPPIMPPRVSITPRSGLKSRSANRHRMVPSGAVDEVPENAERTSGSVGERSANIDRHSRNTDRPSAHSVKPSANAGKLSRVIGDHMRNEDGTSVAWTPEYRNRLSKYDRQMKLRITAHNSHPDCFKPATAVGITRQLTLGNYLPNLSSARLVVRNEVNFWPSARQGMRKEVLGDSIERVTYSRHAMRGTGSRSARLRSNSESCDPNSNLRLPVGSKSHIIMNRLSLVSRSAGAHQPITSSLRSDPSDLTRLQRPKTSVAGGKQARPWRTKESPIDESYDRVATARRRRPYAVSPASNVSDPTPSEFDEASVKVRAWITHRDRFNVAQEIPDKPPDAYKGLWDLGLSPLRRDMMLPLRTAHPLLRSTLTVGNFLTDATASKGAAARVVPPKVGGLRRQVDVPS